MNLIFDQNISSKIIKSLEDIHPESLHVKEVGLNNQSDLEVWNYALENNLVLVSTDYEIFDHSVIADICPKIICVYGNPITTTKMEWVIRVNKETIEQFIESTGDVNCLIIKA